MHILVKMNSHGHCAICVFILLLKHLRVFCF